MSKPLDELYFRWLYSLVADEPRHSSESYNHILGMLYTKEFVWLVPNDDNRIEDAKELRYEFVDQSGLDDADPTWMGMPCSMLELMLGLARRLSFMAEGEPRDWFWEMMGNLRLTRYTDDQRLPRKILDERLDNVIWRTYYPNGRGGLFPLRGTGVDQRDVELWYQMSAYVLENQG